MELIITHELMLALSSFVFGIILGIFYDVFRISRLILHLGSIAVFIEDFIFFIISSIAFFAFCFIFNNGEIRIFIFILLFMGWALYYLTIGKLIYKLTNKVIDVIKTTIQKLENKKKDKSKAKNQVRETD